METNSTKNRIDVLAERISELRALIPQLPSLKPDVEQFTGVVARLGLRMIDRGSGSVTVTLRRHEMFSIPETVTLLKHIAGLKRGGVTPPDMSGIRDLVQSRKSAMEACLLSAEDMDMRHIEPGLDLGLKSGSIDPDVAIRSFMSRMGMPGERQEDPKDNQSDVGSALFADYMSGDLPDDEQLHAKNSISQNNRISRYTHDELIILSKLRKINMKIDGYGYGVANRRRPMFSRARRSVLWAVPRVGTIMSCHIPSWRRQPEIGLLLMDLRRYEQHMRDLAMIPEDDDWFDGNDPLVRSVRRDAWMILRRGLKIVEDIQNGPSAHRFDKGFFNIFPGEDDNYTDRFMDISTPVVNAMAFAGVCGRAEQESALSVEDIAEVKRIEIKEKGIMGRLKGIFT